MTEEAASEKSEKIVLVIGVDLSDVSEHLLSSARRMLRSSHEAELHVVHVVSREPLSERITHPLQSVGASEKAGTQAAQWEMNRLCSALAAGYNPKITTHTPIGDPAQEVIRVAREVDADLVLVETHHDKRLFHVSVATQIVHGAPCSVMTLRQPSSEASPKPAVPPEA
jgi:nucleotide-binding universal stress UspA family protein